MLKTSYVYSFFEVCKYIDYNRDRIAVYTLIDLGNVLRAKQMCQN